MSESEDVMSLPAEVLTQFSRKINANVFPSQTPISEIWQKILRIDMDGVDIMCKIACVTRGKRNQTRGETMSDIDMKSEAYNTGAEARSQGEPHSANPYPEGTWDAINWAAGWSAS